MSNSNLLKTIVVLFLVSLAFYFFTSRMLKSQTPPFILDKLEELKANKDLMDSIGGFGKFEFTFNKIDYEKRDTVRYRLTIKGHRRDLNYRAIHVRRDSVQWLLINENIQIE